MSKIWIMIVGLACFSAASAAAENFNQQLAQIQRVGEDSRNLRRSPDKAAIEWVSIPAGTFKMGSRNGYSEEQLVFERTIRGFDMSKTEVTVAQYKACVDEGRCVKPDEGGNCNWGKPGRENHPVNCVSWHEAAKFAEWAGGRLPSEAEWEYAARSAGKDRKYPWGDSEPTCGKAVMYFGHFGCDSDFTGPVGSKPEGNTEQGLSDMAGNVWEWVEDAWHDSYEGAPKDGSAWVDGSSYRVVRGGSWRDDAGHLRSARRGFVGPGNRGSGVGLRLVRSSR